MAEARTKRLLSPRTRQIGQDVASLGQQVAEKQHKLEIERNNEQEHHKHLLHIESVRKSIHLNELHDRRSLRKATDAFNAQPKSATAPEPHVEPGISALLEFAGELPPPTRRSELVKGLAAQVEAARAQRVAARKAAATAAREISEQTSKRAAIEAEEISVRKQLLQAALDVNAQIIEAKRAREAAEREAEAEADVADISKSLERVEHKRTVILSLDEQAQILADRAAQVAANEERRAAERRAKQLEDERQLQIKQIRDQIAREERQQRRGLASETVAQNLANIKRPQLQDQAFEFDNSMFAEFGVSGR